MPNNINMTVSNNSLQEVSMGLKYLLGKSLEFDWQGTSLGVRIEGQQDYVYVDLKGATGANGTAGTAGAAGQNGADGDKVEVRATTDYIQWKYSKDTTWNNLIAVSSLIGPAGQSPSFDLPAEGAVKYSPGTGIKIGSLDVGTTIKISRYGTPCTAVLAGKNIYADNTCILVIRDIEYIDVYTYEAGIDYAMSSFDAYTPGDIETYWNLLGDIVHDALVKINITYRSNATDGYSIIQRNAFLLSKTEVGLGDNGTIAEGVQLPLFTDAESRKFYLNGNSCGYWLRSYNGEASVYAVDQDGNLITGNPTVDSFGFIYAIVVSGDMEVISKNYEYVPFRNINVLRTNIDYSRPSISVLTTLSAENWETNSTSGLSSCSVYVTGVSSGTNGEMRISNQATPEQREAFRKAIPFISYQNYIGSGEGEVRVVLDGIKPIIDIPVEFVVYNPYKEGDPE